MHTKLEHLLWKSLTTMEVMAYDLVVHTGPGGDSLRGSEETEQTLEQRLSLSLLSFNSHLISSYLISSHLISSHLISSHLGFVHPLQDVALHQCLPSSSVCCLPNPGGSLLLCYVILPSSAWSSSRPLSSPWLPLCASPCPPIVL